MNSVTLSAPAKVNLYLDIVSKRRDGYHNIKTIFQKINLVDTIEVTKKPSGISISCDYPQIPKRQANIAYRAAKFMKEEFRLGRGVDIHITKRIPSAAGLGGGSSDAASVIKALERLFDLKITHNRLIRLAKGLGADVPFFVSGYNCAIGTGIGERLKEIRHSLRFYLLLLLPDMRLYTSTIYNRLRLPLTKAPSSVNMLAQLLLHNRREKIGDLVFNRLESVVLPAYPSVRRAWEALSLYTTDGALLSGSGPTVFAIFNSRKEALRARDRIKKDGRWQLFLTRTV